MRRFFFPNLPIRLQLIILAVLLTLPSLGLIVYSGLKERDDDYKKAAVESQKLADHLAAEQEHLVHEALQLGGLLAELPDVTARRGDRLQTILANAVKKNPQYRNIIICDAAGMAWASAIPFSRPYSLAGRECFLKARSSRRFSSGEFLIDPISRKPTISMVYPLLDRGAFQGGVVISFDLDLLKTVLQRSQLPFNSNYILVDRKGIIISRGNASGRTVGESIQPEDLRRMQTGPDRDTYEFMRGADGDRRITTYRTLRLPGEDVPYMYVRAGISIRTAVARANQRLVYNVAILLPFVGCALGLAIFIGKRSIVDRVNRLQSASQRIAAGDLQARVGDRVSGGELGELGRAFDDMASSLEEKVAELTQSRLMLHEKALLLEDEIAERRQVQEHLAEQQRLLEGLNRTLETRIEAAVAELRRKDQALIQQTRLATMGEMINNIAHQWRQPLNLISLIVQGLPEVGKLSQNELNREVEQIMEVVMHMSQTIDDFRYFFRQDKEKSRFSANQAVQKALELIRPGLNDKGIAVVVSEQAEVEVEGYSNEYAQVLLNILNNARDVLVERAVEAPRISVNIFSAEGRSVVEIGDNGGGIDAGVMPRIFEPYFTTKETMQGSGIGLYMSKIIIEQNMKGSLTAGNLADGVVFRIVV